jgi:hypothetical protein
MPGPNPPDPHVGAAGPPFADSHPSEPIPASLRYGPPVEAAPYPGPLPPPVRYPKRGRRRLIVGALVALLLAGGLSAAILYRSQGKPAAPVGAFSDATATTAIQGYLDALEHRDIDTIARNTLCGIYDAVRDRRSDQALAKLSSDAFRKQFSAAKVTSIDKIVYWSNYQAQVLFSMTVESASGGGPRNQVQGIAQLLMQHNQILVCSYVLRTGGTY